MVALRWSNPARGIAIALYAYRLVGFILFELTGERGLLLLFPNVFEFWFIFVAIAGDTRIAQWSRGQIAMSLIALTAVKEAQEWAIHGARLFDSISALEAIDLVWRRLPAGERRVPGRHAVRCRATDPGATTRPR